MLLQLHPELLPVSQIEPASGTPVPVARDSAYCRNYINNLNVALDGDITLVEIQQWWNAEARREAVVRALHYASPFITMDCVGFETAVLKTGLPAKSLYELVADQVDALEVSLPGLPSVHASGAMPASCSFAT